MWRSLTSAVTLHAMHLLSLAVVRAEPCVIDDKAARLLEVSTCELLAPSATACTRPHELLDYHTGNRSAALAALATVRPSGIHGELDNITELCAMWDAAAGSLDMHELIAELRAAADDGCFEGGAGQSWHPDGAHMLDGLIRWRAVAHFFGAWAANRVLTEGGDFDDLLRIAHVYGPGIFFERAPWVPGWNSVMHYVALHSMEAWALDLEVQAPLSLAPGPARTQWLVRNVSVQFLSRCRSAAPELTELAVASCEHGIGHGVLQLVADQELSDYSYSPCTPLRFKPDRSAVARPQQQQRAIFEEAALGLYALILEGAAGLSSIAFGGLCEAYFATVSTATPDEYILSNHCALLWQKAGELLERTGLTDPQNIRQEMSNACLGHVNGWVHGFNLRKEFVREWQGRFRALVSAQCHALNGEPWGGVNACRMSAIKTILNLQDEPSAAFWCDLVQPDSPAEQAAFFDDWWLGTCVPDVCGLTDAGTDARARAVHSLGVTGEWAGLRNATQRKAAMEACQRAEPYGEGIQRAHVGISERRIGAAYDRRDGTHFHARRQGKRAGITRVIGPTQE